MAPACTQSVGVRKLFAHQHDWNLRHKPAYLFYASLLRGRLHVEDESTPSYCRHGSLRDQVRPSNSSLDTTHGPLASDVLDMIMMSELLGRVDEYAPRFLDRRD